LYFKNSNFALPIQQINPSLRHSNFEQKKNANPPLPSLRQIANLSLHGSPPPPFTAASEYPSANPFLRQNLLPLCQNVVRKWFIFSISWLISWRVVVISDGFVNDLIVD
jgi:hypothetical protein